jgi:alpha-glucosidase (family GH31 glycosyl hydrolase)
MYKLNGMQLGELFNYIDASFYTSGPTKGLIGLFEQISDNLFLKDGIYSLWSRDQPDPMQTGTLPSSNMYGTHPLLMSQGKINNAKSAWNVVFYNLAAAQDWRIKQVPQQGEYSVKTYAAGGMGDIFLMSGQTADEVVGLFHNVVGKPVLVPQWSLGWNQCRWGYTDLDTVKEVV